MFETFTYTFIYFIYYVEKFTLVKNCYDVTIAQRIKMFQHEITFIFCTIIEAKFF